LRWGFGCFLFGGGVVLLVSQWINVKTRGHADPTVSTVALVLTWAGLYNMVKARDWLKKK
jgi:protein-S-isoprenylcysteine O-methyltransferase Ste14